MGSPQDPRARHRQKARRAKKNATYDARKAAEAASASAEKKKGAAAVSKSGR